MDTATTTKGRATPWNKGKLLGQKPPLKLKEIWAVRIRLQLARHVRELALFNLAIDSKLRGCDLVGAARPRCGPRQSTSPPVRSSCRGRPSGRSSSRSTNRRGTRSRNWIASAHLGPEQFLFPSRVSRSPHLSTRQYSRIVGAWVAVDRTGPGSLRDALAAAHQGHANLSPDQESPSGPAAAEETSRGCGNAGRRLTSCFERKSLRRWGDSR